MKIPDVKENRSPQMPKTPAKCRAIKQDLPLLLLSMRVKVRLKKLHTLVR